MSKALADLQLLLLDLLSPNREVPQSSIDELGLEDWDKILAMAGEHRVKPLLDWRLKHDHAQLVVPDRVRAVCADAYKSATLRSLAIQRELLLVHRLLAEGGLPHIFLKGAYLAYFAYPQPGLRAMRDIDILLPKKSVLNAFHYLIKKGAVRTPYSQGHPEAALAVQHHLPPLHSPSNGLGIELHFALFHDERRPEGQKDISYDQTFWERCIQNEMAGETLDFVSPTDLLLHLIEHAVYAHQFDNGPLILSDIFYLIHSHNIDWSLLWRLTDEAGYSRGLRLVLELVSRYYGKEKIIWPGDQNADEPIDERVLTASALLLLRDMSIRRNTRQISIAGEQRNIFTKWLFVKKRIFPSRIQLANRYPVHPKSHMIFLYYPVYYWWLLSEIIPEFLQTNRRVHATQEVGGLSILNDWLRS